MGRTRQNWAARSISVLGWAGLGMVAGAGQKSSELSRAQQDWVAQGRAVSIGWNRVE